MLLCSGTKRVKCPVIFDTNKDAADKDMQIHYHSFLKKRWVLNTVLAIKVELKSSLLSQYSHDAVSKMYRLGIRFQNLPGKMLRFRISGRSIRHIFTVFKMRRHLVNAV